MLFMYQSSSWSFFLLDFFRLYVSHVPWPLSSTSPEFIRDVFMPSSADKHWSHHTSDELSTVATILAILVRRLLSSTPVCKYLNNYWMDIHWNLLQMFMVKPNLFPPVEPTGQSFHKVKHLLNRLFLTGIRGS